MQENMLGRTRESRADYQIAQQKVRDYRARSNETSFADTTRKYSSLLALDADFAKKDFDNELLQHRDIDIRLRPLYPPKVGSLSMMISRHCVSRSRGVIT